MGEPVADSARDEVRPGPPKPPNPKCPECGGGYVDGMGVGCTIVHRSDCPTLGGADSADNRGIHERCFDRRRGSGHRLRQGRLEGVALVQCEDCGGIWPEAAMSDSLLSVEESVVSVASMLGGAIRPWVVLLADGTIEARLAVDSDIALRALVHDEQHYDGKGKASS